MPYFLTKITSNLKIPLFYTFYLRLTPFWRNLFINSFALSLLLQWRSVLWLGLYLPRAVGRSGIGREAQYYVLRLRKWFYNPIKSWLKIMPFMSHGHSHGLRSEVSLIEQDTIECVILAYHIWFAAKNYAFLTFTLCNFLLQTLTNFFLPMKFFLEVA